MGSPVTSMVPPKGLRSDSLGLLGNMAIGLSSTAPAYSLAATLGYVVATVHDRSPAMFALAFVPMLMVAVAYRELADAVPDCGTTFTWGSKAFGPWVGWMGGWGLAVSAIIVLANVAEISGVYLMRFLGVPELADSRWLVTGLGCVLIVAMTWVSYRGIVVSERLQNVLMAVQFAVLVFAAAAALVLVYSGRAGAQAVRPSWSWLSPAGLSASQIAAAVILCIFLYWGWDACLAVGEETKGSASTPGRAAVLSTVVLLGTYVLVAVAVQAYAGFGSTGIGLNNTENRDDVLTVLGAPVGGAVLAGLLLLTVAISALSSTQSTVLPTARGTLAMAVYKAVPDRFARVDPKYLTPSFGTVVMGASALLFYLTLSLVSRNALEDSITSLGLAVAFYYAITAFACVWYFRRTLFRSVRNVVLRLIFPLLGGLTMVWAFGQSAVDMIAPDYGSTTIGGIGGVFVLGVGMLVLGVPLMLACAVHRPAFFRGRTLPRDAARD
ncbi:Amino acid permease-associated region OS=Tsukamurella paurometabola (strain ATCC 8368 / DSM/ CCUG 35730 / CIP 100753 / JCM 10117 / KCTC 9821 / NBRC 16120/ NCIMB 702349 / NCTC 13040) OX=521096 GN=Tpau_0951 PE=4 SV=1 [Tsukamurella paurometabola]|uniref:Amino acid permease-associated region n=2 Tax=Tsukamurella paurometabola TaxID=2061 RepID=D5UUL3_TSUPD|nr:amino acid permease-associated region [Tsukamurella paurometabola DSM 20162]SUP27813.1 Putrescine importer PuuP [Tsukamurella paurometabola]